MDRFHIIALVTTLYIIFQIYQFQKSQEGFSGSADLLTTSKANRLTDFAETLKSGTWNGDLYIDGNLDVDGVTVVNGHMVNCKKGHSGTTLRYGPKAMKYAHSSVSESENFGNKWRYGQKTIHSNSPTDRWPVMINGSHKNGNGIPIVHWYIKNGQRIKL